MAELLLMLLAALAGGVGAVFRFIIDGAISSRIARRTSGAVYPWGILVVNLTGSLLIGVLAGALAGALVDTEAGMIILGVGLLGGYTTFSTASFDTIRLLRRGRIAAGFMNAFAQLAGAAVAAGVGFWVGTLFNA